MKILLFAQERPAAELVSRALRRIAPDATLAWARSPDAALTWLDGLLFGEETSSPTSTFEMAKPASDDPNAAPGDNSVQSGICIADRDPQPGAGVALIPLAEHDGCPIPLDRRDCAAAPLHLESELRLVVLQAGLEIRDTKDRKHAAKSGLRFVCDVNGRV